MQDNRPASGGNVKGEKENKLRKFTEENPAAGWVILHGNRIQMKQKQLGKMLVILRAILRKR